MAAYPSGFIDRWPCKRALAMHRPLNSSVLFPSEMQRRIEESEEISLENLWEEKIIPLVQRNKIALESVTVK